LARKKAPITDEVKKRLDEIFLEEDEAPETKGNQSEAQASPLRELKSVILSIDWEISDEVMSRLLEEVTRLKNSYNNDRIISPFFKMLDSLGRYIKKYKAKANPEAVKVLNSVYDALERILLSDDDLKAKEKEAILLEEVQRFKGLKREIQEARESGEERGRAGKTPPGLVEGKDVSIDWDEGQGTRESLLAALNEVKALIRSEFKTLREEMLAWLDEKSEQGSKAGRKGKKK
jgi:hypothetical protein